MTQHPTIRLQTETCAACGHILAQSDGCPLSPYVTAYPWGDESYFADEDLQPLDRCPDCWARLGRNHHDDCTRARCQVCEDWIYGCEHAR